MHVLTESQLMNPLLMKLVTMERRLCALLKQFASFVISAVYIIYKIQSNTGMFLFLLLEYDGNFAPPS